MFHNILLLTRIAVSNFNASSNSYDVITCCLDNVYFLYSLRVCLLWREKRNDRPVDSHVCLQVVATWMINECIMSSSIMYFFFINHSLWRQPHAPTVPLTRADTIIYKYVVLDFSFLIWNDSFVSTDRISDLKAYQRINHFPGMGEICRKDCLARNMAKWAAFVLVCVRVWLTRAMCVCVHYWFDPISCRRGVLSSGVRLGQ